MACSILLNTKTTDNKPENKILQSGAMILKQDLIVTYSNQKARALKKALKNPLDKVMTLNSWAMDFFEKNNLSTLIEPIIATNLLFQTIQSKEIGYFDYLQEGSETLDLIYDYILKVNASDVAFEYLLAGDKLNAVKYLNDEYQAFKKLNRLVDINDVYLYALENFEKIDLAMFNNIYVDQFERQGIKFYQSNLEFQLLNKLKTISIDLEVTDKEHNNTKLFKLQKEPFDINDEVQCALKLARKLLEDDVQLTSKEICIVTTDIAEYAPIFRLYLDKYDLKGYDSKGIALHTLTKMQKKLPQYQKIFREIENRIDSIKSSCIKNGFKIDESKLKQKLLKETHALEEKIGIELTEANQLVGVGKKYEHIIFIGTDINHFPPKRVDNFLFDSRVAQAHFCENSYYESSLLQYNELKRATKNLYVINAKYKNKRELSPSIIIDKEMPNAIDLSTTLPKRKKIEDEEYLQSMQSKEFTKFDGNGILGVRADHLSASQLSSYAKCPLRYLYVNKLKLKPPRQSEEGLDKAQEGILMHSCFEKFAKKVQDKKELTLEDMKEIMFETLEEEYKAFLEDPKQEIQEENIYHRIFKYTLAKGLRDDIEDGLLAKFVNYYDEKKEEFNYFVNSEFEKQFALDSKLKPYQLKNKDDNGYFIKGFMDRYDNLETHINIIDYKSKKADNILKEKIEEMKNFKDFQLGLYTLYATQMEQKDIDAHLLTFKSKKPYNEFAKLSNNASFVITDKGKEEGVFYDEEYEESLKANIYEIKSKIEQGNFSFDNSDEKHCEYCDVRFVCNQEILNKGK